MKWAEITLSVLRFVDDTQSISDRYAIAEEAVRRAEKQAADVEHGTGFTWPAMYFAAAKIIFSWPAFISMSTCTCG